MKKKEARLENVGINGAESRDLSQVGDKEIRKRCVLTKKTLADICLILGETLEEYDIDNGSFPIGLIEQPLNNDLAEKKGLLRAATDTFKALVNAETLEQNKPSTPEDQYKTDMNDLTSYINLARQALIANNKVLGIMQKFCSDAEPESTGALETSDKKRVDKLTPSDLKLELENSRKKIVEAHNLILPLSQISYDDLLKMLQKDRFSKLREMRKVVEDFNKNSLEEAREMDYALSGDVQEESQPKRWTFFPSAQKHKVLQIGFQEFYLKREEFLKVAEGCGISVDDYKKAIVDEVRKDSIRRICKEIKLLREKFSELISEVRCTKEKVDFDVKLPIFPEGKVLSALEIAKIFDNQYSAVLGLTDALHTQSSKYIMAPPKVECAAPIATKGKSLQQKIEDAKEGLRGARLKYEENRKGIVCDMKKLQVLADLGNLDAKAMLGWNYLDGIQTQKDIGKAADILSSVANKEGNEPAAILARGLCHGAGIAGFDQDYKLALQLFEQAAQKNYVPAQIALGSCFEKGIGVDKDEKKAVEWYTKGTEQGFACAQNSLGRCLCFGIGVNQDEKKAVEWFRKGADQGYALAENNLGFCFELGTGVKQDKKKAREWYTKAAEHGSQKAKEALVKLVMHLPEQVKMANGRY